MNVTKCSACGSENRQDARFCDACGAKIEPEAETSELKLAPMPAEDEGSIAPTNEDESLVDSMFGPEAGGLEPTGEPEPSADAMEPEGESSPDLADVEDEGPAEATEPEEELPAPLPKAGYLVFPDNTEQPIPPSQWLIGRTDLAKYLPDPKQANEISRGHLTVFQEGDRFFVEDGTTMVQRKASTNKTWLVRGSSRILVTGTGRTELQHDDEIDVAELVTLQFVVR
ncbi:MAG: zinc-ribbon domain-containing protein [Methanobacteriota archaeon]|nr:MAG: zinc-ribbon domain-containing protein [Euryarchaeota archaeon]